jgi:hypothetical protein
MNNAPKRPHDLNQWAKRMLIDQIERAPRIAKQLPTAKRRIYRIRASWGDSRHRARLSEANNI